MKKIIGLLVVVLIALFITGCDLDAESENDYTDYLRKCTVMEAADLYTTGGQSVDNVFDEAKANCENMYNMLGEDDFFEAVEEDWEGRSGERIEGKSLSYYLDTLGW